MPQLETVYVVNPTTRHSSLRPPASPFSPGGKAVCLLRWMPRRHQGLPDLRPPEAEPIIFTATPAHQPFLKAEWVQPGTHISCVSARTCPASRRSTAPLFSGAKVFGRRYRSVPSVGECEIPYKTHAFSGELCEIGSVLSPGQHRPHRSLMTSPSLIPPALPCRILPPRAHAAAGSAEIRLRAEDPIVSR